MTEHPFCRYALIIMLCVFLSSYLCFAQRERAYTFTFASGKSITGVVLDNYPPIYAIVSSSDGVDHLADYSMLTEESSERIAKIPPLRYGPSAYPEIAGVTTSESKYLVIDRVDMRDGKVVKGIIVEDYPGNYLVLLWPSGEEWYCYYSDIHSLSKETLPTEMIFQRYRHYLSGRASFYSVLLPGAGHLSNGDYSKSVLFFTGGIVTTVAAYYFMFASMFDHGSQVFFAPFALLCAGIRIWDVVDASNTASDRSDARKSWMRQRCAIRKPKETTSIDFGIAPLPNGAALGVSVRF